MVYRVYSEKKEQYRVEANSMFSDIVKNLNIKGLSEISILNRYDVENISEDQFHNAVSIVFSEPSVDDVYFSLPDKAKATVFAVEYLPGQYDQRADSCEQCLQLLNGGERPIVRTAKVYFLFGDIDETALSAIKNYTINPVESREAALDVYDTLVLQYELPEKVDTLDGFVDYDRSRLEQFLADMGLAMDIDDLVFLQSYFRDEEKRNPTVTEIRMIDTYWSDHCRHTTFLTEINNVVIEPDYIKAAYRQYEECREQLCAAKPQSLMDIATIGAKYLNKTGKIELLDESEEINACSVRVPVKVNGEDSEYLLMFKNETHNHPTEIEPFGGAATCLGGAIRDPLSGRAYVYQAMRVTGSGDPRQPVKDTIKGKLPQRYISNKAAAGYSSYGNQIGLATGLVNEIYHKGYVAKRMEIGAVIGAVPAKNVRREAPVAGDVVILVGGRTGRDGCGGATGSSKSHTLSSLSSCGAEVQKGNPITERKIQRLFRNPEVAKLIKRCNDFGAGGVSVAIGELADGLTINLDAVPTKYEGIDGTELAISESQERMAVVVEKNRVEEFLKFTGLENIEATVVAEITDTNRLLMVWKNNTIVSISRDFLNSNGAKKSTDVVVKAPDCFDILDGIIPIYQGNARQGFSNLLSDLNICSQKGLCERFDASIGASTVLMPFGGKYQLTPTAAMAAKLPDFDGDVDTSSIMAYGFNVNISSISPFHGAVFAIVEAVCRAVATGARADRLYLTLQEYFPATKSNPERWGLPFAALLGALSAQLGLGYAAIGGKDSMSGSFEDIDVPPTLVAFAAGYQKSEGIISPEFKQKGSKIVFLPADHDEHYLPDYESVKDNLKYINNAIADKRILSCLALSSGGIAEAIFKMASGNKIGARINIKFDLTELNYGGFIYETESNDFKGIQIGKTSDSESIIVGTEKIPLMDLIKCWEKPLENIFPTRIEAHDDDVPEIHYSRKAEFASYIKNNKPRIFIPVFPGTNCEYDTAKAFERAGGSPEILVLRNINSSDIENSVQSVLNCIKNSNIIALPGGFSGGDEPEGSGKFISAFFRNPVIIEAIENFLYKNDGLMLGICNGFQALIKLGLLPFGHITPITECSPTLTFNTINRHKSCMVSTRIASNNSPWLSEFRVGDIHTVAVSHGEGRFVAQKSELDCLISNGQVATQYVDPSGKPTMQLPFNPNGSEMAIEGIVSPDGRVFGKMAHSERYSENTFKNIYGNKNQNIFRCGINYFKF